MERYNVEKNSQRVDRIERSNEPASEGVRGVEKKRKGKRRSKEEVRVRTRDSRVWELMWTLTR